MAHDPQKHDNNSLLVILLIKNMPKWELQPKNNGPHFDMGVGWGAQIS